MDSSIISYACVWHHVKGVTFIIVDHYTNMWNSLCRWVRIRIQTAFCFYSSCALKMFPPEVKVKKKKLGLTVFGIIQYVLCIVACWIVMDLLSLSTPTWATDQKFCLANITFAFHCMHREPLICSCVFVFVCACVCVCKGGRGNHWGGNRWCLWLHQHNPVRKLFILVYSENKLACISRCVTCNKHLKLILTVCVRAYPQETVGVWDFLVGHWPHQHSWGYNREDCLAEGRNI